jgi:prephenate dehydratase
MNIYYQWEPWAYSHIASLKVIPKLSWFFWEITGLPDFDSVWEKVVEGHIGVIPIENSYAGNVHNNLYNFLKFDCRILWEYHLEVQHRLLSLESDISKIKKVYSHPQALSQCHKYLFDKDILPFAFYDTAGAAKYISESRETWAWAIASKLAGEIYELNVLDNAIQDQVGNTTRFFIIVPKESDVKFSTKSTKITILFEAKNIPSSLYSCLWVFANNTINLTKIESIPSFWGKFSYFFWIDFEWNLWDLSVKKALRELQAFTSFVKILGEY